MKTLSVSVPEQYYDHFKYSLDQLASEVITQAEAGQRGNKRSAFILMIATAGINHFDETVRLLKQIKQLTQGQADAS